MPDNTIQLAVVIPAYKATYWRDVLQSLADQTDRRFVVYVGDDAGDAAIRTICGEFEDRLQINYHRFDENLGGRDLVAHWNRCVERSSEPWIWLFSDDDFCDREAVEKFYQAIEETEADVYRFDTTIVDGDGKVTRENPAAPDRESSAAFALSRISEGRRSYVVEYVFSRRAYEREGGFVSFPQAWFSDDASWIAFARETGIVRIAGPRIYWRYSDANISGKVDPLSAQGKVRALFMYREWLARFTKQLGDSDAAVASRIRRGLPRWLYHQLGVTGCYGNFALTMRQTGNVSGALGCSRLVAGLNLLLRWIKARVKSK